MKKFGKTVVFSFVLLTGIFLVSLILSQKCLIVRQYTYRNPKIAAPIRAVQLTDLHNYQYGRDNQRLIAKIQKQKPDVIFMTGDMLNEDEDRTDILLHLVREACAIAPVYFSLGNHEVGYEKAYGEDDLTEQLEAAGAVVLEKEYVDTKIAGQEVRIGGVYGYLLPEDWEDGSEQRFLEAFVQTDRLKILLSHVPEGLLLWKSMEYWDVDLVFSGHVHGGQVRVPFVGGLFDPEEGFFPTYTRGMFSCGNGTMILSAGLGSSRGIPRVNNLPEIVVCDIVR
ncbi:metallophosphoesterase [Faecalimonas umbilicata]|uniref:metallophosphoesterase n=1 Tax=Faecalimonas umbilicata TaxID=1912855 RepID=UPI0022E2381B|nr:metallophosphoesterase [Faecalimonas umbilicata]